MRIVLFLCLLGCFCLGCARQPPHREWWQENGKLKILTTIAMIRDLVQEIGGEHVDVLSLICGELDPHSYELVKGDDEKFTFASLVFYNGLGLEHALSLRQRLAHHPKAIAVTEGILESDPEAILSCQQQYDPHIWMDIALWMRTIAPIVDALSAVDPLHAEAYRARGEELYRHMESADQAVYAMIQAIPEERRFLITSHDAFHYFARHYLAAPGEINWRERCAAPEGLAPDAQLSIADIYAILNLIEQRHVHVLFPESNLSKEALRKIVKAGQEKGYCVMLAEEALYGDSMGQAKTYLEMMHHNAQVISQELTREVL